MITHSQEREDEGLKYLDLEADDEPVYIAAPAPAVPMAWSERMWIAIIVIGFSAVCLALALGVWDELKFIGRLFR